MFIYFFKNYIKNNNIYKIIIYIKLYIMDVTPTNYIFKKVEELVNAK